MDCGPQTMLMPTLWMALSGRSEFGWTRLWRWGYCDAQAQLIDYLGSEAQLTSDCGASALIKRKQAQATEFCHATMVAVFCVV